MEEGNARIIAVAGKGGVGKTSLAATMVRVLVESNPGKKILAIDADPAVGLSTALGIDVELTIDDIRKEVVATVENGETATAMELLAEARYRIFDAIVESNGFAFMAIGRPEGAGCYCKINAYLKQVIKAVSANFDYIVIDGEAGIEQVNRRVMEKVSHLVLVTDSSRKGTQVIKTIKSVADTLVMYERVGVIVNRMPDPSVKELLDLGGLEPLAFIETDTDLATFDIKGENVFFLPENAKMVAGVREALRALDLI